MTIFNQSECFILAYLGIFKCCFILTCLRLRLKADLPKKLFNVRIILSFFSPVLNPYSNLKDILVIRDSKNVFFIAQVWLLYFLQVLTLNLFYIL